LSRAAESVQRGDYNLRPMVPTKPRKKSRTKIVKKAKRRPRRPAKSAVVATPRPAEPVLREIVPAGAVRARIVALAAEVARDFSGKLPLFVVIAEGARRFADELKFALTSRGLAIDSLVVRARRTRGAELVEIVVDEFDATRCTGRDLLLVDDIADEGRTLTAVLARVRAVQPASVKTAVLVSKHSRRCMPIALDYVGFDVADGWVLGFGMDLEGKYRELDHLAVVDERRSATPTPRAK
jgi:hypoxanthine phosphoribosyltransferase